MIKVNHNATARTDNKKKNVRSCAKNKQTHHTCTCNQTRVVSRTKSRYLDGEERRVLEQELLQPRLVAAARRAHLAGEAARAEAARQLADAQRAVAVHQNLQEVQHGLVGRVVGHLVE